MPRITMQLPPHVDTVLGTLSREEHVSKVLVIRRALLLYARLLQAVRQEGYDLALSKDGVVVREILLDVV